MRESDNAFRRFADLATWQKTDDGWVRQPFNGFTVELVDCGNGFYQPIVNRHLGTSWAEPGRCDNLEQAIRYAWDRIRAVLESRRDDDGPPAQVAM